MRFILFCFILIAHYFQPGFGIAFSQSTCPFLIEKVKENHVTLFGTTHAKDEILDFLSEVLPKLPSVGVTHIGLEIDSDQQSKIDHYMKTGEGLDDIHIFWVIDCPKYRNLLSIIRKAGLEPVAIDLPKSKREKYHTRDEWMGLLVAKRLENNPKAKVFVIIGSAHTLKDIHWRHHPEDKTFRFYLEKMRPEAEVYTIYSCAHGRCAADEDEFRNISGVETGGFVLETEGLDIPFKKLNYLYNAEPLTVEGTVDSVLFFD